MAIKRTRWRPDTCTCDLEYEWDDSVPQGLRVHTGVVVHAACPDHATVLVPVAHHALVLEENQRKNIALDVALTNVPSLRDVDGNLRSDAEYIYSFKGDRGMNIAFRPALTTLQKTTLQGLMDARFGVGKVTVG